MDLVDLVLVAVIVFVAVAGLWLGAVIQLLTLGGFLLGMAAGALISSLFVGSLHTPTAQAVVSLLLVMGLAVLFGSVGRLAGGRLHAALRRHRLGGIDSALGVGVAVVEVLLSAWLLTNLVAFPNSRLTWLSSAVQRSDIMRTVDEILPPVPSAFESFLSGADLPPVFADLVPPTADAVPVPSLSQALSLSSPDASSTVKVLGEACGSLQEGSGFAVGKGLVVTNAHVVAGEFTTDVQVGQNSYRATPVLFDPNFDLAVLRTDAPLGSALPLSSGVAGRGVQGAVLGYPEDGPFTVLPAGVSGDLLAEGRNIYGQGLVTRTVLELDAPIRPGNSGGPVVATDGQVVGVVFSRSTEDSDVGYALASPGVLSRVQEAEGRVDRVSTGGCVSG